MTISLCGAGADGTQEAGNADADGNSIVFLYQLKAGACPKSYGLQVRPCQAFTSSLATSIKTWYLIATMVFQPSALLANGMHCAQVVHCECLAGMQVSL